MTAEDDLRLAWQAARDGRPGMRDVLLTLAVAAPDAAGAPWAERCRLHLVRERPGHPFVKHATLTEALANCAVIDKIRELRELFPHRRVQRLLQRADVLRGTYTGRKSSLGLLVEEMLGPYPTVRKRSRPRPASEPLVLPAADREEESERSLVTFYLTVLIAIAMLLACTLEASDRGSKAA